MDETTKQRKQLFKADLNQKLRSTLISADSILKYEGAINRFLKQSNSAFSSIYEITDSSVISKLISALTANPMARVKNLDDKKTLLNYYRQFLENQVHPSITSNVAESSIRPASNDEPQRVDVSNELNLPQKLDGKIIQKKPTNQKNKGNESPGRSVMPPAQNYVELEKQLTALGERGEQAVITYEINRLMTECHMSEAIAKESIVQESKNSDLLGFDIRSKNADGTTRYIEVKATNEEPGAMSFFYSDNELRTARSEKCKNHYYLYLVFCANSPSPKIAIIKNPFLEDKMLFELHPVKYRVDVSYE